MEKQAVMKRLVLPAAVIGSAAALWTLYKYLHSMKEKLTFREQMQREIHIVNTVAEWEAVYPVLMERCQIIKALGFDCEWVVWGHRLPVALIQLATHDGLCVLVRIFKMADAVPDTLRELLANKSILKIGVSSKDDGKKLLNDYGMHVSGCIDLRHIQSRVRAFNCSSQSLQGLAAGVLGVSMVKDREIRCGDWEAEQLSEEQIAYAAADALIAVDIFMKLVSVKCGGGKEKNFYGCSVPTDEVSFWRTARSLCQGIVDTAYKPPKGQGAAMTEFADGGEQYDATRLSEAGVDSGAVPKPGRLKNHQKAFMTRQRPLYYNCRLLSPDGQCLTTCDIRKAQWYIDKGLGNKVQEEPLVVQLNFHPSDPVRRMDDYLLQDRENVCVVCGATQDYVRRHIVPQEYRKPYLQRYKRYWPETLQVDTSHQGGVWCTRTITLAALICKVSDEPLVVQLNFEPVNRPSSDKDYYLQEKENVCVVCGADSEYIRKIIVPQEYRKYFPTILKDHSSHDVLLLCISCHLRCATYDMALRQRLAVECDAPMASGKDAKKMQDQDLQQVVSAARALLKSRSKIPEARIQHLEGIIKNYYGVQSVSEDLLKTASSIDYTVSNSSYVPHGKKVVEFYMKKEGGLLEFEKLWRRQFVETMEPKFLPPLWSIEHKPERMQPLSD